MRRYEPFEPLLVGNLPRRSQELRTGQNQIALELPRRSPDQVVAPEEPEEEEEDPLGTSGIDNLMCYMNMMGLAVSRFRNTAKGRRQ